LRARSAVRGRRRGSAAAGGRRRRLERGADPRAAEAVLDGEGCTARPVACDRQGRVLRSPRCAAAAAAARARCRSPSRVAYRRVPGENGAGKTTTVHILSGAIEPSSGSASVAGYAPRAAARVARGLRFGGSAPRRGAAEAVQAALFSGTTSAHRCTRSTKTSERAPSMTCVPPAWPVTLCAPVPSPPTRAAHPAVRTPQCTPRSRSRQSFALGSLGRPLVRGASRLLCTAQGAPSAHESRPFTTAPHFRFSDLLLIAQRQRDAHKAVVGRAGKQHDRSGGPQWRQPREAALCPARGSPLLRTGSTSTPR
jgi:energy-coupling factor transporter ATP-binding protein EcfA2